MADERVLEGKVIHSFNLSSLPAYHNTLSWSSDDRISIITDQAVYVLTLLLTEEGSKSNVQYYLSSIPAKTEQFDVDFKDYGLDMHDFSRINVNNDELTRRFLYMSFKPQKNSWTNLNAFKAADWSPSGCDQYGRCILAASCQDHSLALHMSCKSKKSWTEIASISELWYQQCQKELLPDVEKKLCSLKTGKGKNSKPAIVQIPLRCSVELNYLNNVWLSCFAWYPTLINSSLPDHVECYALLAAVTLSGQLTFWQVGVPVLNGKANVLLVEKDIKCSFLQPCSLAWFSTDTDNGLIAIGSTDGRIEILNVTITINTEGNVAISRTSSHVLWNDVDELAVSLLTWFDMRTTKEPSQPTYSVSLAATKGSSIVQFSLKLNEDKTVQETCNNVIDTDHQSFISAASGSNHGKLFTCDPDNSIQMTYIDTKETSLVKYDIKAFQSLRGLAVSPNSLYMAMYYIPSIHKLECRGVNHRQVEVSIVSLVSEESLSKAITLDTHGTMWDLNTGISQYYNDNDPPEDGPVIEYLGRPLGDLPLSSLYIRHHLTGQLFNQSDESFDDANSDIIDLNDGRDWKLETMETGRQIVRLLVTSALKLKLDKYKDTALTEKERTSLLVMSDWLVMNYTDQVTLDLALQVYSTTNERDSIDIATSIRQQGIMDMTCIDPLTCGIKETDCATSIDDNNEESEGPPSKKSKKVGKTSQKQLTLPCRERCTLCQTTIPLVSLTSGQCTNRHAWKRCVVSFCVCADYTCRRCQDCGNVMSLIGQDESPWLRELIESSCHCRMCLGWQDSRS